MPGLASRLVNHLFATARNRDGQAAGLEQVSTLAGLVPTGSDHELDDLLPAPMGRPPRRRPLRGDALRDAMAQKVLHGWVRNRNQTLHPLTLNLSALSPAQAGLLLEMVALALAAGGDVSEGQLKRAAAAIEAAHGGAALAARLPALLASPRPLHVVFDALRDADLTGSAYAITVAAVDQRDLTNRAFAAYAASRLAIPETVSRSIGRRYRR